MIELTQSLLKDWLIYDSDTGIFTWKKAVTPGKVGKQAGSLKADGYLSVWFNPTKNSYLLHRLAWLYVFGKWPENEIDHINGIRSDNRLENLRDTNLIVNRANRNIYRNNSCGLQGVRQTRTGKFTAQIQINKKLQHLGTFATAVEASEAYQKAKQDLLVGLAHVNNQQ